MKERFLLAFLICVLLLAGCLQMAGPKAPRMAKEELRPLIGQSDLIVIDVRIGDEWSKSEWKIKGALREDPEKLAAWRDKYPKDKTLVFY